jgi:hypothetical protein
MILFTGTTGINNVDHPFSIGYDPQAGVSDLAYGVNINITPSGGIERTDGYSLITSGDYHSVFCDKGDCFLGKTTWLKALENDKTTQTIVRSGLTGARISFAQVGYVEGVGIMTLYTNGTENGMIVNKVSYPWPTHDIDVSLWDTVLSPVPVSDKISFKFGRVFFTTDKVLYWTEHGLLGLYSPALNNKVFGSRIIMIKPVDNGMFLSDEKRTYFMAGRDPHSWTLETVAEYPAYEWSDSIKHVEGSEIGASPGQCALWNSPEGACLGTAQGQFVNLNKSKVIYPETGRYGASLLRGYQLINSIF